MSIIERIGSEKVVAVIRLDDLSQAVGLAQALIAGGVSVIEFTLTNPDAVRAIAEVREAVGNSGVIGAGSVITADQVNAIADAGGQFVVSPVTKQSVIEACHNRDLPTVPGAYTPTEIQAAWEMEVAAVKVFPSGGLGARYIKDVLAPLPHLRLIPTGGINRENINEFLKAGAYAAGIGSALFKKSDLAAGDRDAITATAAELKATIA